ncbi:MAG: DHH family phosphoesterase, partial [Clostridia bacterium]
MTGSHERVFETHLRDVMPKLDLHWLIEGKRECPAMFGFGGKNYRILGNIVRPSDDGSKAGLLATLYWIDNTELVDMRHTFAKTRQIAAILMIDNFEEIMNGVADSGRNAILAAIDEKIAKWTEDVGGILLKSERDRYIFIFEERYLEKYREEKFNLLDAVREVESSNGIRPTLSIGVGKDGSSYLDNYKSAELAIEMSLSRGGDQAIIRNKFNFEFFGGHSAELEKRTKVKSRVMSNALAELIKDASNVLVMGHKAADNDSIGAAVGILAMARRLGRGGSIVVRHQDSNAEELYSMVSADEYYNDAFITAEDAMVEADGNTLLVVVDTNRPQYVESQ